MLPTMRCSFHSFHFHHHKPKSSHHNPRSFPSLNLSRPITREATIHLIDSRLSPKARTDRPVSRIPPANRTTRAPIRRPALPAQSTYTKLHVIILMLPRDYERIQQFRRERIGIPIIDMDACFAVGDLRFPNRELLVVHHLNVREQILVVADAWELCFCEVEAAGSCVVGWGSRRDLCRLGWWDGGSRLGLWVGGTVDFVAGVVGAEGAGRWISEGALFSQEIGFLRTMLVRL